MGVSPKLIICVSDLHCGSTVGLLAPGFSTLEGNPVKQNEVQKWLWACWLDCIERVKTCIGSEPAVLILNGDLIEGVHHRSVQIISADVRDHVDAATQAVAPLTNLAKQIFVIEGTEAHTGNAEHSIAKSIGAVGDPDTGKPAFGRLSLTINGVRHVFFHHISTTSREWLKASALSIFLANEQVEAANNGETVPRVLGCAHRHVFGAYRSSNGLGFVTPAWQVLTRYGQKVVPAARCKPGMVVLDYRKKKSGELPELHAILCKAPDPKGISL